MKHQPFNRRMERITEIFQRQVHLSAAANAGSINQRYGYIPYIIFVSIASRVVPGNIAYNDAFLTNQAVQQTGFTTFGFPTIAIFTESSSGSYPVQG
jgi:uncharacterized membrane protein